MIMTIAIWGWIELGTRIQTGDVVTDLQRPVDLQGAYLAEDLGRAGYQFLARGIPPFVIGALFFEMTFPGSAARWIAFFVSVVLAVVVSFGMRFIVNLMSFWVLDWRGFNNVSQFLVGIGSGFVLPLAFYPDWIERLLVLLPWASMIQGPINIFIDDGSIAGVLALQCFWVVALLGIGRLVLRRATLRVVVQGG
jgi:ABC-2 type transport system permease protein